jgi:hypothetical protein
VDLPNSAGVEPETRKAVHISLLRRFFKYTIIAAAILVAAGVVAPFINANSYGQRIQGSLEASLGRKVSIGKVRFTLFAGPGFSIEDVTIADDPRYGIEPFAYVPLLIARVRLDRLIQGRVEFAELRLASAGGLEPTLNLTKRADGTWNVVELADRLGHQGGFLSFLPALKISDARLNFKLGDRKSMFYVDNADVAAYAESGAKVRIEFAGTPSRTDRSGPGFSSFEGEANWYRNPTTANPTQLEISADLRQSNLSEMITLVEGYDVGIHGYVSSHLQITGPARALAVRGDLRLDDVHRWDLTPSSGESWNVHFGGVVDLAQNRIQLETIPRPSAKPTPVQLQVRVNDFLTSPYWSVIAQLKNAPAENLLPLSQRLGIGFPEGLTAKGIMNGAIGYASRSGWNGAVALENVTATVPGLPPFNAPSTTVSIAQNQIHLQPSLVESPAGASLLISGDYSPSTRALVIDLNAEDASAPSLSAALTSWFGQPPVVGTFESGTITGHFRYTNTPPEDATWSDEFQVSKGVLTAPGLAAPVRDFSGRVVLNGKDVDVTRFSASIGGESFTGDYHYRAKGVRRERLRISAGAIDLSRIQDLLEPALGPNDFFSRFRFGRRSLPAWLAHRNLEADVAFRNLSIGEKPLGAAEARLLWIGPTITIPVATVHLTQGKIAIAGVVSLSNVHPRYSLSGEVAAIAWKGGLVNLTGNATSSGLGTDILRNLQASGDFDAHDISPVEETRFSNLAGRYTFAFDGGWPNLQLTAIAAEQGDDSWQGTATSDRAGNLNFDLSDGARPLKIATTLIPTAEAHEPNKSP